MLLFNVSLEGPLRIAQRRLSFCPISGTDAGTQGVPVINFKGKAQQLCCCMPLVLTSLFTFLLVFLFPFPFYLLLYFSPPILHSFRPIYFLSLFYPLNFLLRAPHITSRIPDKAGQVILNTAQDDK